jgi:hypothetical protein
MIPQQGLLDIVAWETAEKVSADYYMLWLAACQAQVLYPLGVVFQYAPR